MGVIAKILMPQFKGTESAQEWATSNSVTCYLFHIKDIIWTAKKKVRRTEVEGQSKHKRDSIEEQ